MNDDPTKKDFEGRKPPEKKDGDRHKPLAKPGEDKGDDEPGLTVEFILPKDDPKGPGELH